ncbi:MAG TPA: hypothetical protein VNG29_04675 [Candidatus Paceibacterota bacterium]|nr:hypothetical protein [Candidatus Paceibacterota bacterium]
MPKDKDFRTKDLFGTPERTHYDSEGNLVDDEGNVYAADGKTVIGGLPDAYLLKARETVAKSHPGNSPEARELIARDLANNERRKAERTNGKRKAL